MSTANQRGTKMLILRNGAAKNAAFPANRHGKSRCRMSWLCPAPVAPFMLSWRQLWAVARLAAGSHVMADDDARQRLARLKRDQRARAKPEAALKSLLADEDQTAGDKLATVKAVQKVDQRRVLSAVRRLLDDDSSG